MLLLAAVIVVALVFAWFTLKDINTPTNLPLKKADEMNGVPLPMGIPEIKHVEEVIAEVPVAAAKIKKAKIATAEKTKKTRGRKKKTD